MCVCFNVTEGHTVPGATQRVLNDHTTCWSSECLHWTQYVASRFCSRKNSKTFADRALTQDLGFVWSLNSYHQTFKSFYRLDHQRTNRLSQLSELPQWWGWVGQGFEPTQCSPELTSTASPSSAQPPQAVLLENANLMAPVWASFLHGSLLPPGFESRGLRSLRSNLCWPNLPWFPPLAVPS